MTDPAESRARRGGFQHDVTHLHAVWRGESAKILALTPVGLAVAEIADGLACYSEGREVGRLTVRDGAVTASPPFAAETLFPDRVTYTELAGWLISAKSRLP